MKIKGKVEKEFEAFVQEVSKGENLTDWTLDIWGCKGESVCEEGKIIRFGICGTLFRTKWLFLHEVAHALASTGKKDKDWDDSYWHRRKWQEIFARLFIDYLPEWYYSYKHREGSAVFIENIPEKGEFMKLADYWKAIDLLFPKHKMEGKWDKIGPPCTDDAPNGWGNFGCKRCQAIVDLEEKQSIKIWPR